MSRAPRRRWLAPEIIQTSTMDCGPASVKCLLEGFGIQASYGRLREVCQTDVDGTSIDTAEEVVVQLGLRAAQVMQPAEHLLIPQARLLPAMAVVRNPRGETHFVVVWRRHGPLLQVMDPAVGRRWVTTGDFLSKLYIHAMAVPAADWRDWAGSDETLAILSHQLTAAGMPPQETARLLAAATADPGWETLATLEAATRMTLEMVSSGGMRRGPQTARLLAATFAAARDDPDQRQVLLPKPFWSVQDAGDGRLTLRGAVLVRVRGLTADREPDAAPETGGQTEDEDRGREERRAVLSPELEAAVRQKDPSTWRELWRLLREDGTLRLGVLAAAFVAAGAAVVVEALVLRGFLDLSGLLGVTEERLAAFAALVLLLLALLGLELPAAFLSRHSGRHLEIRLRRAFLRKIPLLGDRFFHSRPVSDMTERCHAVFVVRVFPELAGRLITAVSELVLTTAAIVWIAPDSLVPALGLAAVAVGVPAASHNFLAERDLRMRTHRGALIRFYLDVLLGAVPLRVHGAEKAVRRSQEELLTELARAKYSQLRASVTSIGVQSAATHLVAAWLVFSHLGRSGGTTGVLLLVYWAMKIPGVGQQIALSARQFPSLRSVSKRLFEPLGAPEEAVPREAVGAEDAPPRRSQESAAGIHLHLQGVGVRAGGHTILTDVDLDVAAGSHVAIVGPSGAGKSTLVSLFLGWHRPYGGRLLVDGEPLEGEALARLRRLTAWIDPAICIWNRSLYENLCYGNDGAAGKVGAALEDADLHEVVEKLPLGLQTGLGEGGGRLSGGEGQRLRMGRALLRPDARLAILDEPFRGLDRDVRHRLLVNARRHWRHATLLCVTHDVEETRDFDRVVVIEDGRLVETGNPAELAAGPSRYRRMLEARESIRQDFLHGALWRRLFLADGRISAEAEEKPR